MRRPTQLRRRVFHRDHPTWDADSFRGLFRAKRLGYEWIDLNFCVTGDGWLVNLHWPRPLLHGYCDPLGTLRRNLSVSHMRVGQALRLRSRDGDRVHTAEAMIALAGHLGVNVELEVKPGCPPVSEARAESVAEAARKAGVRVVVKTLTRPGTVAEAVARLVPFHEVGIPTLLLPRGSRRVPRSCWGVVDHVRGPVFWFGPKPKEDA